MSLARGIQSAIFHYLSCAPCTGYAYRKKRRKEAKRDRIQRQREMELRSPDQEEVYQHPDPSNTNPFWEEEMTLGPGPPKRRGGKRKDPSKIERTNTAMSASTGESKPSLGSRTAGSSLEAVVHDVVLVDSMRTSIETLGENWNRKRYQREDEELWGFGEITQSRNGSVRQRSVAGSSVGLSGASRPGTAYSSTGSYYIARAPPVNDLHPPVVSLLSPNVGQSRWMLQPPPKAAVQMGRERPMTRNRSDSGGQSKVSLHRQVSEKKLREMMEQGEIPQVPIPPPVSKPGSKPGSFRKQKSERDNQLLTLNISNSSHSLQSGKALTMQHRTASNRSRRSVQTPADSSDSDSSSDDATRGTPSNRSPHLKPVPGNAPLSGQGRTRPTRPKLSPVVSHDSRSAALASQKPAREQTQENVHHSPDSTSPSMSPPTTPPTTGSTDVTHFASPSREDSKLKRHPLSVSDYSSLNALQDRVTQRHLLDLKIDTNIVYEAGIQLPPVDKTEEILLSDDEWVRGRNAQKRWSVGF